MSQSLRHRMIGILISLLGFILFTDAILYHLDPLGIVDAVHANHDFHMILQDDITGYRLPAGTQRFHHWTATILPDGSRAVPATNVDAPCTIATIGDSMTFGQGVEDSETWVNMLAGNFPDVQFINPARPDYSAPNIAALKLAYAADGYLWLLIGNDDLEAYQYHALYPLHPYPPATALYRHWLFRRLQAAPASERQIDETAYWQAVGIIQRDDTRIVGFRDVPLTVATDQRYPVALIPAYTAFVSPVDSHPNADGHQQIAHSLYPYVAKFLTMVCNAEN